MSRAQIASNRLLSIHYLRVLAAIMVVVYHVYSHGLLYTDHPPAIDWLREGTAIFFVVSGFVMVSSTADGRQRPAPFFFRRIKRIVPLYWFATFYLAVAMREQSGMSLLGSLLFLPLAKTANGTIVEPIVEVGWTLNFEMAFYAVFALAMCLTRQWAVWTVIVILSAFSCLNGTFMAWPSIAYYCQPVLLDFVVGMLIAHCGIRAPRWCLPLGFVLLATLRAWTDMHLLAVALPAGLIVASILSMEKQLREVPMLMLLGEASYAIYISHMFVVYGLLAHMTGFIDTPLMFAVAIVGSISTGVLVHLSIEKPLARLVGQRGGIIGKPLSGTSIG